MPGKKKFSKNLIYLEKTNPLLAFQLSLTDPEGIDFCLTQADELNLVRCYEDQQYYYHSSKGAVKEAKEWFEGINLDSTKTLFVYGIGLGYYYEAARFWLNRDSAHSLVFLEEDLGVLHRFFETELGSQFIQDPQAKIYYLQDSTDKAFFNELSWTYFKNGYAISSLKLYEQVNPEGYEQLRHQLTFSFERKKHFVGEYLEYGLVFFRNFYLNLLQLPNSYMGNHLFNCFPQVPAIICGAGPSLDKNLELLRGIDKKALLIAGGSALNALIPQQIIPHFGVAIDPHPTQYCRIAAQSSAFPFFYRGRLFHEALMAIQGPRLYLNGTGGFDIAHWFEHQLRLENEEDLDEGHNVVNFSIQIAQALGCNPIILVGVDLAFTNQHDYAQGVESQLNLTKEHLNREKDVVERMDIFGKPTQTLWKWIIESQWISEFAQLHPENTLINATEGGLGFKNVSNCSLQEVLERFVKNDRQEIQTIRKKIEENSLKHISEEEIRELMRRILKSLKSSVKLISELLEKIDQFIELIVHASPSLKHRQSQEILLLENQIEQQIAYTAVLEIFNKVYIHLHHREIQEVNEKGRRTTEKKRRLETLRLNKKRFMFLHDAADYNQQLLHQILDPEIK